MEEHLASRTDDESYGASVRRLLGAADKLLKPQAGAAAAACCAATRQQQEIAIVSLIQAAHQHGSSGVERHVRVLEQLPEVVAKRRAGGERHGEEAAAGGGAEAVACGYGAPDAWEQGQSRKVRPGGK